MWSLPSLAEFAMSLVYLDIDPHSTEDAWISSVLHVSTIVILYYDYILTLLREIEFLWPLT